MAQTNLNGHEAYRVTPDATQSFPVLSFVAEFDPTSSSQISLGTLPKGARPIGIICLGGATGGSSPTVDIGSSGNDDGLANELDADAAYTEGGNGADTGVVLTVDTEVFGKVGGSAATGGTTIVIIQYIMA